MDGLQDWSLVVMGLMVQNKQHTDRYLDFSSHHPLAHKIAVVRTLHTRAESINSLVLDKNEEMKHLRQALTSNGYPKAVIHHHSMQSSSRTVDRSDTQGPVVTLPYVQGVSEAVCCILVSFGPIQHSDTF